MFRDRSPPSYIFTLPKGRDGREHVDGDAEEGDDSGEKTEASADDEKRVGSRPDPDGGESRRRGGGIGNSRHWKEPGFRMGEKFLEGNRSMFWFWF